MQRHVLVTDIAEQKGIEQGIEKGIEQGIEQGVERVVIGLLESGEMDDRMICRVARLSHQQLTAIKKKIAKK